MKKRIVLFAGLIATIGIAVATFPMGICATESVRNRRTCYGYYQDYMQIVTDDGNIWKLSDFSPAHNPYMKKVTVRIKGKRRKVYVPKFQNYQRVKVIFDTEGTKNVKDDRIVSVKAVKSIKGTVKGKQPEVFR